MSDTAQRWYEMRSDITTSYLISVSGWIAGYLARLGLHRGSDEPEPVLEALMYLEEENGLLSWKAKDKIEVMKRLNEVQEDVNYEDIQF